MADLAMWIALEFERKKNVPQNKAEGEKWARDLFKIWRDAGVTELFPCMRTHDNAVGWQSDIEVNDFGWDVMGTFLNEGAKHGIRIEPWVCMWGDGQNTHPEWQAVGTVGRTRSKVALWMCPGRPEVHDYFLGLFNELMDRYDVSGIHLDYARYHHEPCCCEFHKSEFQRQTGFAFSDLTKSQAKAAWEDFSADCITDFVREMAKEVFSMVCGLPNLVVKLAGNLPKLLGQYKMTCNAPALNRKGRHLHFAEVNPFCWWFYGNNCRQINCLP